MVNERNKSGLQSPRLRPAVLLLAALHWFVNAAWCAAPSEWDALLGRARQEKRVVLGTDVSIANFRQGIASSFAKQFGIDLEFRVLEGAQLVAIAARECAAGRPSMDVLLSGNSELLSLYPKGCLAPVKPKLILPEVLDTKYWRGGVLKWNDPEGQYLLQTSEAAYGWTVVNTDQIKQGELTSAKDLLRPEYKNKIASFDPRSGGAGQGRATYMMTALGEDYVRSLYVDQKVTYTSNHQQLAEWVARGVYAIGLGAVERVFEPMRKEGLPIGVIASFSDAPGYLTGGSSVMKLIKDAPHPNAAGILLNWFASKEAQEIYSQSVLQPTRRTDVNLKDIPEYLIPKAGAKYVDSYGYEFYTRKRPEVIKRVIELLGR
ncbi:MAG TPA: extracellular solute-binding protein [Methylomirabilota bacterium]|nr:extracellular solute-binding protein [Methylomirabilota bacterium]